VPCYKIVARFKKFINNSPVRAQAVVTGSAAAIAGFVSIYLKDFLEKRLGK